MVQWRARGAQPAAPRRSSRTSQPRPTPLDHGLGSADGSTPEEAADDWGQEEGDDHGGAQGEADDWWGGDEWETNVDEGKWHWGRNYGWLWRPTPTSTWTLSWVGSAARAEETTCVQNGKWMGSQRSWSTRHDTATADDDGGRPGRTSEKIVIPSFSGEGGESDLGTSARSYLRKVEAWSRCSKMATSDRAVALY